MTPASILRALDDPMLLGGSFTGESWNAWRALLAGAFALPLTEAQAVTFRQLTDRDPPAEPVRELWIIAGRRSGKSRIASAVAVALAACQDWPHAVGEVPVVLVMAADREQAQVAFRYARGLLSASPLLAQEVESETRDRITLKSGVELQVVTSDFRAVRGRSVPVAVLDEVAFWMPSLDSASPDVEVLAALRPALATFPGSLLIGVSSPYSQAGVLFETFRRYYGEPDPRVLVARAPSLTLNPSLPPEVVAEALQRDPEAARAEWLAEFRSDLSRFIDAELVDSLTRNQPRELPRMAVTTAGTPIRYVAGLDVSGGRGDACGIAIAHLDGGRVIVDAVRRWPAPHDPAAVAVQVAEFLKVYSLRSAVADQYGAELARTIYRNAGIELLAAPDSRSDCYLKLLPLMTSGKLELPPDPVLRLELLGLERKTARSGRDSVDHRSGSHDDLSNACALAAVAAARQVQSGFTVSVSYSEQALAIEREFGRLHINGGGF